MIEKLKALGESAKGVLLYILAPLGVVLYFILQLVSKNRQLGIEVKETKAEKELAATMARIGDADEKASISRADYELKLDQYRHGLTDERPSPPEDKL